MGPESLEPRSVGPIELQKLAQPIGHGPLQDRGARLRIQEVSLAVQQLGALVLGLEQFIRKDASELLNEHYGQALHQVTTQVTAAVNEQAEMLNEALEDKELLESTVEDLEARVSELQKQQAEMAGSYQALLERLDRASRAFDQAAKATALPLTRRTSD